MFTLIVSHEWQDENWIETSVTWPTVWWIMIISLVPLRVCQSADRSEMEMGPFIPNQPNLTHKLSNSTQNVINTDPTQVTQPNPIQPMGGPNPCPSLWQLPSVWLKSSPLNHLHDAYLSVTVRNWRKHSTSSDRKEWRHRISTSSSPRGWRTREKRRRNNKNKNLYGRDGRTICGPQCVPKSTDALSACRKVHPWR